MKQMLVGNSVLQDRIAILEDGRLMEYFYVDKSNENCLGNIYKGRVTNILPGIQAAFIDIGMSKNAYLYIDSLLSNKFLTENKLKKKDVKNVKDVIKKGDELLVQVLREPLGEKNVSVTTDISISGKYTVLVPGNKQLGISRKITDEEERKRLKSIGGEILKDNNGIIFRTYSQCKDISEIRQEYDSLVEKYKKIDESFKYSLAPKQLYKDNNLLEKSIRDYVDDTIDEIYVEDNDTKKRVEELLYSSNSKVSTKIKVFTQYFNMFEFFKVEKQIEQLTEKKVNLKSGGSIIIEKTEALTVVDVNSGSFVGDKGIEDTALKINLEAAHEIARQIKLRNISGIIIIDFIDIKTKVNSKRIVDEVKKLFKNDKVKTSILGMTKLNLLEMTRKREKESAFNDMINTCKVCNGSGRVISPILILLKVEDVLKRLKSHTSCEAVILKVNNHVKNLIESDLEEPLNVLKRTYDIEIFFNIDKKLQFNDLKVEKMGKLSYINQILKEKI